MTHAPYDEPLTKREKIAAMAMMGLLTSHQNKPADEQSEEGVARERLRVTTWISQAAVAFADALLARLAASEVKQPAHEQAEPGNEFCEE